ncbi:MAG: hypothetical protein FWD25_13505, partial [Clostridia bacterium]|nr:hypothetical protein [Clostridia bacterium]
NQTPNIGKVLTATQFVDAVKSAIGWAYWYGTCGYDCSESLWNRKKIQYPTHYSDKRKNGRGMQDIAAKRRCADCVGLIKWALWSNGGTCKAVDGSNGVPDTTADGMYKLNTESGSIDSIPDTPGLIVWKNGHIGVYVGDGIAVEARGWDFGVVQTKIVDRSWTHWAKLKFIAYPGEAVASIPQTLPTPPWTGIVKTSKGNGINLWRTTAKTDADRICAVPEGSIVTVTGVEIGLGSFRTAAYGGYAGLVDTQYLANPTPVHEPVKAVEPAGVQMGVIIANMRKELLELERLAGQ